MKIRLAFCCFRTLLAGGIAMGVALLLAFPSQGQRYDQPDRGQPGDSMIQEYLARAAGQIESEFLGAIKSAAEWDTARSQFSQEYLDMLGLWPLPARTPLQATTTGTIEREGYVVEKLHYQSRPGLYVTANLYRPAKIAAGERLPGILYVCGHSSRGRNGNKTAFQSHGIWFARHGYVCLLVDTLQLGEIAAIHHGTYREGRWWWLSRGYTPAGIEAWNGIRGLDYLSSRPDVDPARLGVTGISGGGAATFWIAAADERVKVAVPVSGMADLLSYVSNRVINGHCDCMFLYNTFQWPWARIAGLVAPRPLLFVNSDQDPIFPMDANERVINRLERLYSLFGASDVVDSMVSIGGHAYRQDIRQAAYRFLNTHLKHDPRPILDSERDLVTGPNEQIHPIPPEQLRAFPQDTDIPRDELNTRIDEHFVPIAKVDPPAGSFTAWREPLVKRLRQLTFHHFPDRVPPGNAIETNGNLIRLETEAGISIRLRLAQPGNPAGRRIWIYGASNDVHETPGSWFTRQVGPDDAVLVCEVRGTGGTQWTRKNPPNYVERSHYLLGRTVDSGRVWDLAAAARFARQGRGDTAVWLAGEGAAGVRAVYAAVLEPEIGGLVLQDPMVSHMDPGAPALLNVLRTCDVPEAIGLLAPRPVRVLAPRVNWGEAGRRTAGIYQAAGAEKGFRVEKSD